VATSRRSETRAEACSQALAYDYDGWIGRLIAVVVALSIEELRLPAQACSVRDPQLSAGVLLSVLCHLSEGDCPTMEAVPPVPAVALQSGRCAAGMTPRRCSKASHGAAR
jgi:hypothetical protein